MKAVLISIKPKWCEMIASGKKTIEVRKTMPNIETPFKCYIYCTKKFYKKGDGYFQGKYCGKVIGEFECDRIIDIDCDSVAPFDKALDLYIDKQCCLTRDEFFAYTQGRCCFGFHISHRTFYDHPKELSEFRTICKYRNDDGSCQFEKVDCDCCYFYFNQDWSLNLAECLDYMVRPPQSWCYVESLQEKAEPENEDTRSRIYADFMKSCKP